MGVRKEFPIPTKAERAERRQRQARELEANQQELRDSIAESERLVGEAEVMINRHRKECDTADGK